MNPNFKFALRKDLKNNKEFLPTRAEPLASGWDVRAAMEDRKPLVLKPFQYAKIQLGFRAIPPEGYWYELKPRSSSFAKKNMHALYGTIDEGFENELLLAIQYVPEISLNTNIFNGYECFYDNNSDDYDAKTTILAPDLIINFGDAIGQIIPVKRQEMDVSEISNKEYDIACKVRGGTRGKGGFGSTNV